MIVILGGPKIPLAKFWVGTKLLSLLQLRNVGWVRAQSAHPITTSVHTTFEASMYYLNS